MKADRYNQKGFTLIEAMMAMTLLAMAAGSLLLPFAYSAAAQLEGGRRTFVANVAADLLEEIVNTDFDSIIMNYDGYYEPAGWMMDANAEFFTDPAYATLARVATCQPAMVANVDLIWASVYVYDNGMEVVKLSTLISR